MRSERVSAGDEERARRIAYALRTSAAIAEAGRMRGWAGCRLAHGLEHGLHARSAVLAALTRREAVLHERRTRAENAKAGAVWVEVLLVFLAGVALILLSARLESGETRGPEIWPDEVCERCGRAGAAMDAGCAGRED